MAHHAEPPITPGTVPASWSRRRWLGSAAAGISIAATDRIPFPRAGAAQSAPAAAESGGDPEGLAFVVLSDTHYTAPQDAPDELISDIVEVNRRLMHHIDLLRYSQPCSGESPAGGEWSACDVEAYHQSLAGYNVAAIFHGHLHGLRTDHWDGSSQTAKPGAGIPAFGVRAGGAAGTNRGYFHCTAEGGELVVRERVSLRADIGWLADNSAWGGHWRVPLRVAAG